MAKGEAGRRRRWWPPLLALLGAALALLGWSLASPVGSAQDDDFHLATIWCSPNAAEPLCAPGQNAVSRIVPGVWAATFACPAPVAGGAGRCMQDALADLAPGSSTRGNWDGNYPGYFHDAMAVFATQDIAASVIAMRLANSALFLVVTTLCWLLLPRRLRGAFAWSTAIALVPQGAFLIASTNPESWALTAAAVIWVCCLAITEPGAFRGGFRSSWRSWALTGLLVGAVLLGAAARADAAGFAAGAVVLTAIIRVPWTRRSLAWLALPAVAVVAALVWYLGHKQSTGVIEGLQSGHITEGTPSIVELSGLHGAAAVLLNAVLTPGMWIETWSTGLGSHQIAQPGIVALLAVLLVIGIAVLGLRGAALRKRIAVLCVVLALWVIPVYLLARTEAVIGAWLNPRYLIPLIQMGIGLLLLEVPGPSGWRAAAWRDSAPGAGRIRTLAVPPLARWTAALAVATMQAAALLAVLQWYVAGTGAPGPLWWWPELGWLAPALLGAVGALGGAIAVLGLALGSAPRAIRERPVPAA